MRPVLKAAALMLLGLAALVGFALLSFGLVTTTWMPAPPFTIRYVAGALVRAACCLTVALGASASLILSRSPREGRPRRSLVWLLAFGTAVLLTAYLGWNLLQNLTGVWHGWPTIDPGALTPVKRIPLFAIPLAWCATWAIDATRRSGMIPG